MGRRPKDAQAEGATKRSMRIVRPGSDAAPAVDKTPVLSQYEKAIDF